MGFDVIGNHPKAEVGKYLRRSVWSWHPLIEYAEAIAPAELMAQCRYWHSNDGDGLNKRDSEKLAEILTEDIESGNAERYCLERNAALGAMEDELCELCAGTGKRDDAIFKGKCNGCEGTGKVRPWQTHYGLSLESITGFRDFLAACGGFKIC